MNTIKLFTLTSKRAPVLATLGKARISTTPAVTAQQNYSMFNMILSDQVFHKTLILYQRIR